MLRITLSPEGGGEDTGEGALICPVYFETIHNHMFSIETETVRLELEMVRVDSLFLHERMLHLRGR